MAQCPNKNLKEWKQLVAVQGEDMALYLWDKHEGNVPENYYTSLTDTLVDGFLKDFNITATEYTNMKDKLGLDAVSAADLVSKSIAYQEGESITPEVAYFAYNMLGKQNNKIRSEMRYLINKWDKYTERFAFNKQIVMQKQGIIKDKKEWYNTVRDLTVIDFLKEKLQQHYMDPQMFEKSLDSKWTAEDFSTWKKIMAWIEKFLFSFSRDTIKKAKLDNLATSIADEVLNKNYEYFNYELKEDQIKKYYKNTIESDQFAKDLVEFGQKELNIILTGSLALRRAGSVYRIADESLHDIDWVVPYNKNNSPENIEHLKRIKNYQGVDKAASAKLALDEIKNMSWFKKFKEKYPTYEFINGFYGGEHKSFESLTVQGVIDGEHYPTDGFHEQSYSTYRKDAVTKKPVKESNTKTVKHKKGEIIPDTGYVVDFFVRLVDKQDEHENYFKLWKEIMIAKLKMARDKDFTDWKAFVPYLKSKDEFNFNYEGFRHFTYNNSEKNAFDDSEYENIPENTQHLSAEGKPSINVPLECS